MNSSPLLPKHKTPRLILCLLALWAYHLAWVSHPAAAFNWNAFDLAEQIRTHPAMLAESPPLRTSMFLWAGLACLAITLAGIGGGYRGTGRWMIQGGAVLLALRLLPPAAAWSAPGQLLRDDYTFVLSLLSFLALGGVGLMMIWPGRWYVLAIVQGLGLILPLIGFNTAYQLWRDLGLDLGLGGGLGIYLAALSLSLGLLLWGYLAPKHAEGQA